MEDSVTREKAFDYIRGDGLTANINLNLADKMDQKYDEEKARLMRDPGERSEVSRASTAATAELSSALQKLTSRIQSGEYDLEMEVGIQVDRTNLALMMDSVLIDESAMVEEKDRPITTLVSGTIGMELPYIRHTRTETTVSNRTTARKTTEELYHVDPGEFKAQQGQAVCESDPGVWR